MTTSLTQFNTGLVNKMVVDDDTKKLSLTVPDQRDSRMWHDLSQTSHASLLAGTECATHI